MDIYKLTAIIGVGLFFAIIIFAFAIRFIAPRLPRRKTAFVNIRDRHGRIVGVEQREVRKK